MSFFKITIDKADTLFSRYIRMRDRRCVKCGQTGKGKYETEGLTNSHFWSRRYEGTRFNPLNCDSLCIKCHMEWEHEKISPDGKLRDYGLWKLKQLGKRQFDMLEFLARKHTRKDRQLALIYVKTLMQGLEKDTPKIIGAKAWKKKLTSLCT